MPLILPALDAVVPDENWADQVRSLLGVEEDDLPDEVISSSLNVGVAEAVVIRRVPNYATITDQADLLFLKMAVIHYIAYTLAPGMAARMKQSIQTLDVKWSNQKIDWEARAAELLQQSDFYISNIQSVELAEVDVQVFGTAKALPKNEVSNEDDIQTWGWWGARGAYQNGYSPD